MCVHIIMEPGWLVIQWYSKFSPQGLSNKRKLVDKIDVPVRCASVIWKNNHWPSRGISEHHVMCSRSSTCVERVIKMHGLCSCMDSNRTEKDNNSLLDEFYNGGVCQVRNCLPLVYVPPHSSNTVWYTMHHRWRPDYYRYVFGDSPDRSVGRYSGTCLFSSNSE